MKKKKMKKKMNSPLIQQKDNTITQLNTTKRFSNRDFYITAVFFILLFCSMIGYYIYFLQTKGLEMINSSYNARQYILASQNTRGTIYSADGEVLAETRENEEGKEIRHYPYERLFAHAVGFSTKGKSGIEAQANAYLINSSISLTEKANNEAAQVKNPGDHVYTSLRKDLQEIAYKSLGVYQGAIIVSKVKTGEILAMVSKPDFNPETIVQDWEKYLNDKDSSVLVNRVTQGIYPPGSTFKLVTALSYLRQHQGLYDDYQFQCRGSLTYGNSRIICYHGTVHGQVDFTSAFAKSCNCAFADMGLSMDKKIYQNTLYRLGFNQKLPVSFPHSQSNLTLNNNLSGEEMIQISFGQGSTQMTPLHLHLITNAIALGGTPMKPYLIERVVSAQGTPVKTIKPESADEMMSVEEATALRKLMKAVVDSGTASRLKGLSYTAAGKTGSAEYNQVKEDSHAWFTGFAPAEDPEISVTIIIEKIGSGGDYAVPIAKRIFDAYFGL